MNLFLLNFRQILIFYFVSWWKLIPLSKFSIELIYRPLILCLSIQL